MFNKILKIITGISLITYSLGHAFMKFPIARRSKYGDYYIENDLVDYNIASPLYNGKDNYIFPCKGFPIGPVISEINSNTIKIQIEPKLSNGISVHGGGHCQFGIVYDDKFFIVIKQIIRDCLINTSNYEFTIENLPNRKVTVFWTWINAIGNREYYMDCADVKINIPNNNIKETIIHGKELIIANILGFPTIPEFPEQGMYDGRELLKYARNRTIVFAKDIPAKINTCTTYYTIKTSPTENPIGTLSTIHTPTILTTLSTPTKKTIIPIDDKISNSSNKNKIYFTIFFIYIYLVFT